MSRETEPSNARKDEPHLPGGVVLKRPVSLEDLKSNTEYDPEGAEEFVTMIRTLRREGARPVTL